MRDLEKKKRDDGLPANKPKESAPEARKSGQEPAELEEMKNRLAAGKDTQERKTILGVIQERFGNQVAEKVIAELRLQKDGSDKTKEV